MIIIIDIYIALFLRYLKPIVVSRSRPRDSMEEAKTTWQTLLHMFLKKLIENIKTMFPMKSFTMQ